MLTSFTYRAKRGAVLRSALVWALPAEIVSVGLHQYSQELDHSLHVGPAYALVSDSGNPASLHAVTATTMSSRAHSHNALRPKQAEKHQAFLPCPLMSLQPQHVQTTVNICCSSHFNRAVIQHATLSQQYSLMFEGLLQLLDLSNCVQDLEQLVVLVIGAADPPTFSSSSQVVEPCPAP